MKSKMFKPYMETARSFALLSYAERRKVGAVAITPQDVMLYSWNGRVAGGDNVCEIEGQDVTRPDVLHAEANIVSKAAREGISLKGSIVVVTLSPCLPCAMQMYQAGVKRLIYDETYRDTTGIDFLREQGVQIDKYEDLGMKVSVEKLMSVDGSAFAVIEFWKDGKIVHEEKFYGYVDGDTPYERVVRLDVDEYDYAESSDVDGVTFEWRLKP